MIYEFEIITVKWHHNRGNFIFARHLGEVHDINVPNDSLLGDILVDNYSKMRPLKDKDNNPRWDIFVFQTFSIERLESYFIPGQKVMLTTKHTALTIKS